MCDSHYDGHCGTTCGVVANWLQLVKILSVLQLVIVLLVMYILLNYDVVCVLL